MNRMMELFLDKQHATARELDARGDLISISWPAAQHALVELRCIGLVRLPDGRIVEHDHFAYGVHFADDHLKYVEDLSLVTLLAPLTLWHTNAGALPGMPAGGVCIGPVAPAVEIDEIVFRLWDLTTFENFAALENDCINRPACAWARAHVAQFPTDHRPAFWSFGDPVPAAMTGGVRRDWGVG